MRKTIAAILVVLCLLTFFGCQQRHPDKLEFIETSTENNAPDSYPPEVILHAEETRKVTVPESTEATTDEVATLNPTTETAIEKEVTEPSRLSRSSKEKNPEKTKSNEPKTSSTHPAPTPTVPKATQPETEPTVTTPAPSETEPTNPEPTQPETKPTVPATKPTEPTGCAHDRNTIHHKEKGHWKAGIVCDCGWTIYGNADELISKWNAHSASYPAEEALFEHGGYGSADKWIVDEPAYDEWVCSLCREPKP